MKEERKNCGSDLIPQDTAGYRRLPQETAGYLYIITYHFILINFIARKHFMDIYHKFGLFYYYFCCVKLLN